HFRSTSRPGKRIIPNEHAGSDARTRRRRRVLCDRAGFSDRSLVERQDRYDLMRTGIDRSDQGTADLCSRDLADHLLRHNLVAVRLGIGAIIFKNIRWPHRRKRILELRPDERSIDDDVHSPVPTHRPHSMRSKKDMTSKNDVISTEKRTYTSP